MKKSEILIFLLMGGLVGLAVFAYLQLAFVITAPMDAKIKADEARLSQWQEAHAFRQGFDPDDRMTESCYMQQGMTHSLGITWHNDNQTIDYYPTSFILKRGFGHCDLASMELPVSKWKNRTSDEYSNFIAKHGDKRLTLVNMTLYEYDEQLERGMNNGTS